MIEWSLLMEWDGNLLLKHNEPRVVDRDVSDVKLQSFRLFLAKCGMPIISLARRKKGWMGRRMRCKLSGDQCPWGYHGARDIRMMRR